MTERTMVYGASGFGREVAWLVECCLGAGHVCCFIDDDVQKQGSLLNEIPILSLENAASDHPQAKVVSGIGNPKIREIIMNKSAAQGLGFATFIHPNVEMSRWINIGKGTVICAGNILTTNITLGRHVQINLDCTIGHDVIMGDYATLAPGVHVSGCVHIGKRAYIGTGAVIINGTQDNPIIIGDDVVVGAGACVTKSISYGTWGGCLPNPSIDSNECDVDARFENWQYPEIEEGKPTKYNWVVQNVSGLNLGYKTDIGAFSFVNKDIPAGAVAYGVPVKIAAMSIKGE